MYCKKCLTHYSDLRDYGYTNGNHPICESCYRARNNRNIFHQLSAVIKLKIASYIPITEIHKLSLINKNWYRILSSDYGDRYIWENYILSEDISAKTNHEDDHYGRLYFNLYLQKYVVNKSLKKAVLFLNWPNSSVRESAMIYLLNQLKNSK